MREEVEVLEDHAHLLTVTVDVQLLAVRAALLGDVDPLEDDGAGGRHLQQVQRAEEGALAGAGGADDDHDIALVDVDADAVEGLDVLAVIILLQVLDLDQLFVIGYLHGASSFPWQQRPC